MMNVIVMRLGVQWESGLYLDCKQSVPIEFNDNCKAMV